MCISAFVCMSAFVCVCVCVRDSVFCVVQLPWVCKLSLVSVVDTSLNPWRSCRMQGIISGLRLALYPTMWSILEKAP